MIVRAIQKDGEVGMTYGQLFMKLNPSVKVVENSTCVWIYFDCINHDTFRTEWWNKEIPDETPIVQKPRVMTLAEIEDALDTVVWVEEPQFENFADYYGLIEAYSHKAGFVYISFGFSDTPVSDNYYYSGYGKTWRCWTSRPTDEQRKAVKWE